MTNKTIMASVLTFVIASFGANAADQGQGVVKFTGSVIDAPCGIASDSADQTIKFDQISKSHLAAGGVSVEKTLDIKLVNCDVSNIKKGVQVTFSGNTVSGAPSELVTAGPSNTAVVINGYGGDINFATATDTIQLKNGDNTLRFLTWVKQATGKAVAEGAFDAVANFKLSYE